MKKISSVLLIISLIFAGLSCGKKTSVEESKVQAPDNAENKKEEEKHDKTTEMLKTGYSYYKGEGVEQNQAEALACFRKAAEQGNAEAQLMTGICYYKDEGVEKNWPEALKWFRKAAEQGNAEAQCMTGICYVMGKGVEKNQAEAIKWFQKAAAQGHKEAKAMMGAF